jgi:hypothetical protein
MLEETNDGHSDSEEEQEVEDSAPAEACKALETTLKGLETQHVDGSHLLLVQQWRDKAAKLRRESLSK